MSFFLRKQLSFLLVGCILVPNKATLTQKLFYHKNYDHRSLEVFLQKECHLSTFVFEKKEEEEIMKNILQKTALDMNLFDRDQGVYFCLKNKVPEEKIKEFFKVSKVFIKNFRENCPRNFLSIPLVYQMKKKDVVILD